MKAQSRQSPVRLTKHYLLSPVMGTCHQHIRAQASWLWDASSSFQNGSTNVATTRIVSKSWRTLESKSQRRVTFIIVRCPYDKREIHVLLNPHSIPEHGILSLTVQMRTTRHKECKQTAQDHTGCAWWRGNHTQLLIPELLPSLHDLLRCSLQAIRLISWKYHNRPPQIF